MQLKDIIQKDLLPFNQFLPVVTTCKTVSKPDTDTVEVQYIFIMTKIPQVAVL